MGTVVPSGIVVVVAAAVRLTCCWPNPATTTRRRNTLTTAAAFNVALHFQSLIRIMVFASRRRYVLDRNVGLFAIRHSEVAKLAAWHGRQKACPTVTHQ
jgi:hypothetical protein